MMKKIAAGLLALCLLCSLVPAAQAAETESIPSAYLPAIRQVIAQSSDTMFGEAMLCDLDGAGTPELVMLYLDPDANYRAVTAVYTVRSGEAVQMLAPTPVYTLVGGNSGYVAVVTRGGTTYFMTHSAAPEVGYDTVTTDGTDRLYAVRGKKLALEAELTYHEELFIGSGTQQAESYVVENESYSIIDGARESYAAYEAVMDSITIAQWNLGFTDEDYGDDAMPLRELRNLLATGFTDVPAGQYYSKPIMWAAENGITAGTSATTFSPKKTCTRAEFVTLLWRTMGSPAPQHSDNPFRDVQPGKYYYKAVLWAVEQGITAGTTPTTFSPNRTCSRSETVTFLWRLNGAPKVALTTKFQDVSKGAWYARAVAWAVQENVTAGTGEHTFSPAKTCTRAETVTFLYRNQA